MDEIARILSVGRSDRAEGVAIPTDGEVAGAETALRFRLPDSYREFLQLGGLSERRIHHSVLSPQEIVDAMKYLPDAEHIPFADNGCGDLYCWARVNEPEPVVLFADHESGQYKQDAVSFTVWLEKNRF